MNRRGLVTTEVEHACETVWDCIEWFYLSEGEHIEYRPKIKVRRPYQSMKLIKTVISENHLLPPY
jgi:hypothetical protein